MILNWGKKVNINDMIDKLYKAEVEFNQEERRRLIKEVRSDLQKKRLANAIIKQELNKTKAVIDELKKDLEDLGDA